MRSSSGRSGMIPKPLVLFDVDGTLLLTGGAGMRAMKQAAAELFGERFRFDGIVVSGHLDPLIFAEAALLSGLDDDPTHHERFRARYLELLLVELTVAPERVRCMPGIRETLQILRQTGLATPGLLTGNYPEAIPLKLRAIGVEPGWFEITAFGDEAPSRAGLVELAIEKYTARTGAAVDPRLVIIVGDTPRDIECAHAHGCFAFAVATGAYDAGALEKAGADLVVTDLGDPAPLIETIERLANG
jgi:phosphoglycolate phosphatase